MKRLSLVVAMLLTVASCRLPGRPVFAASLATDSATYTVDRRVYGKRQTAGFSVGVVLKNTGNRTLFVRRLCDDSDLPAFLFERTDGHGPSIDVWLQPCVMRYSQQPFALRPGDSLVARVRVIGMMSTSETARADSLVGEYLVRLTVQTKDDLAKPPSSLIPAKFRTSAPFRVVPPPNQPE